VYTWSPQHNFDLLRGSSPRLKFTVMAASVLQSFCFRILISWFLLLAGSLNHPFAYLLAPGRIFRPVNLFDGRSLEKKSWLLFMGDENLTSAETSLDTMHQSCFRACHGHSGYGDGYGGGYGPLAGHWKEDVTCKVSNLPFTNLTPEVTSTKSPYSLDDFLVVEMFINEDHYLHRLVRRDQKVLLHFDLKKHHCSWSTRGFFDVYVMHGGVISLRSSSQCSTLLWRPSKHLVLGVVRSFREWVKPLRERDFFVLLYCNTQSYCIRERLVSLSYVGYK